MKKSGVFHLVKAPGKNEHSSSSDEFLLQQQGKTKHILKQMEGVSLPPKPKNANILDGFN